MLKLGLTIGKINYIMGLLHEDGLNESSVVFIYVHWGYNKLWGSSSHQITTSTLKLKHDPSDPKWKWSRVTSPLFCLWETSESAECLQPGHGRLCPHHAEWPNMTHKAAHVFTWVDPRFGMRVRWREYAMKGIVHPSSVQKQSISRLVCNDKHWDVTILTSDWAYKYPSNP